MTEARDTRIGAAIAGLRRERGWSQRELAEVLGLPQSAVSRIETGRRGMAPDQLEAFAQALGVPATSLLDASKTPSATRPPSSATRRAAGRLDREALLLAVDDADAVYQRIHARRVGVAGPLFPSRDADRTELRQAATQAAPAPIARNGRGAAPDGATLPGMAEEVIAAWFTLRDLTGLPPLPSALSHLWPEATPRHHAARFWRRELGIETGSPVSDLVPLLEDVAGVEVIVARLGDDTPAAGHAIRDGVAFLFVNAARPVALQRIALARAFGHVVLERSDTLESEGIDFADEFLAPAAAVAVWYERRDELAPDIDTLMDLAAGFGIDTWAAMYRSRAAHKLSRERQVQLTAELRRLECHLLARQAFLGGFNDTLTALTPDEALPGDTYGPPAVLRVPRRMRVWALRALSAGGLSVHAAAGLLSLDADSLARELERAGIDPTRPSPATTGTADA
jgi:transcriptional regulator with XRE-family HTH domain